MTNDKGKRKARGRKAPAEGEETQPSTRRFIRSLLQAGVILATNPVNMLPQESRGHVQAAGREFTRGLAALTGELADSLEKLAEEPKEQTG